MASHLSKDGHCKYKRKERPIQARLALPDDCPALLPGQHLVIAAEFTKDAQSLLIFGTLKIHQSQCKYVADKLLTAVKGAQAYNLLWERYVPENCHTIFKKLCRVSQEVNKLVRACCKEQWLQVAVMSADLTEQLFSLVFELEVCTTLMHNSYEPDAARKTLTELGSFRETEINIIREKSVIDRTMLWSRLNSKEWSSLASTEEKDIAKYLVKTMQFGFVRGTSSRSGFDGTTCRVEYTCLTQLESLGKGSSASVHRTIWLGENFAEKTFFGTDNQTFKNEVLILSGLSHPNIVPLLCYAINKRKCSLVMELMDRNLFHFMQEKMCSDETLETPFDPFEAVDIMLQVAEGMHYLHQNKVVHRDLKSENILIKFVKAQAVSGQAFDDDYMHVKVADFGLSKIKEMSCTISNQTMNTGTTRWMAPELFGSSVYQNHLSTFSTGEHMKYPFKSDVYSFGMVCYEILTGNVPFSNLKLGTLRKKVPEGLRPDVPECPNVLATLIESCWHSSPSERPSFGEICKVLRYLKCVLMADQYDPSFQPSKSSIKEEDFVSYRLEQRHGSAHLPMFLTNELDVVIWANEAYKRARYEVRGLVEVEMNSILSPNSVRLAILTVQSPVPESKVVLWGFPDTSFRNFIDQAISNRDSVRVQKVRRIRARLVALQDVIPNGDKVDIVTMAINHVQVFEPQFRGMDQLRPGLAGLAQKMFMKTIQQNFQQYHQFPLLTPHQQQLLQQAQAQCNMSSSGSPLPDMDPCRFRVLLGRNGLTKDGQSNASGDFSQGGVGSPMRTAPLPQGAIQDQIQTEPMMKQMKQLAQMQQQQAGIHQQQQPATSQQRQQHRLAGVTVDVSNSFRPNDPLYGGLEPSPCTNSTGTGKAAAKGTASARKTQQLESSSGPANSTGTANRAGPSPNSAPSTSSTHMPEDIMSMDGAFSFHEVTRLRASTSKVVCCHFSSEGKLLASAGHDKKARLWEMDTFKLKSCLEEHSLLITDVRFSPYSMCLATSSCDRTVRVWDADNPNYSLRTFTGHQTSVMSLDFHPNNEDLLCSCDNDSEIRYWSVNHGLCTRVFKGGITKMRFQPRQGRLLAAAAENIVSIFDVDSGTCVHTLQRHTKPVHSVCWDASGDFVASVSEDSVRVWNVGSGGAEGECVHELSCNGNKFHSCVFHPNYHSLLVIGCYQSLELWNIHKKQSITAPAHDGLIAALATSAQTGMVASASHDKSVQIWK